MKLFKQRLTVAVVAEQPPIAPKPGPEVARGVRRCGELGCAANTGLACAYVDRRNRACPTAWCPEHRRVIHDGIYCPVHADTLLATDWEFATGFHPDLDNQMPSMVATVARALEDDVVAMLHQVCAELHESLLSDPVRYVLVGVGRVRTWERSWKTASPIGVGCRVAVCIEERRRDILCIRVNSEPVLEIPTPWTAVGLDPGTSALREVAANVLVPIGRAVHEWTVRQVAELEGGRAVPH